MIGNFPYLHVGCYGGWQRWAHRPVTDLFIGNHSDGFLMKMGDEWKIWYTHVQNGKIHVAASDDGFAWRYMSLADHPFVNEGGDYRCAITRRADLGWACLTCHPWVIRTEEGYRMYFTGISELKRENPRSVIGVAFSKDGAHWEPAYQCVLEPDGVAEENRVAFPMVCYENGEYRMWYTAAGQDRPSFIAAARSKDGLHWEKEPAPVWNPQAQYERWGAEAPCVVFEDDWYYMAYAAWEDEYKSRICLLRSKNGLDNWQSHRDNPIITWGTAGTWDVESVFSPRLLKADDEWRIYYTGRRQQNTAIGMVFRKGSLCGKEEDWK